MLGVGGFKQCFSGNHQKPAVRRSLSLDFRREFNASCKMRRKIGKPRDVEA